MNKEQADLALFFAVRHGETFLNGSDMYRGWSNGPDAHLNKRGVRQATQAGIFLHRMDLKFTKIYSSDLDRAKHTSAILASILGITQVIIDTRLRPLNVGVFAGMKKSEHPITHYVHNTSVSFPGGESIDQFDARQRDFANSLLEEVKEHPTDEFILQVCHVSNIMFWQNIHQKQDEYLDEKTDLVNPGGVVEITEDSVIPLFRENKLLK